MTSPNTTENLLHTVSFLPEKTGVYVFKNSDGETLYVGKALNLKRRVSSYFQDSELGVKNAAMLEKIADIEIIETFSEFDALLLEASLIKKIKPKYNIIWRDDKHPLYIKLTIKEEFPKVTTSRREDDSKAVFFGPFPSSRAAKDVLHFLRRVFPYCAQTRIGKRVCFYTHLGLCDPCPARIIRLDKVEFIKEKRRYRQNIFRIKAILEGKSQTVLHELEKEMSYFAGHKQFEDAAIKRDQILNLRYVTQRHFRSEAYLLHPDFTKKRREEELLALKMLFQKLATSGLPLLLPPPTLLSRIECFDVSNIMGKEGTGSMVTFIEGEAAKDEYKRFRIRFTHTPNDTAMIEEILRRRFRHAEWSKPNLVIVDGGKGQLNAALSVLRTLPNPPFVIGLAKRLEEIVLPLISDSRPYQLYRLEPGSLTFHLLTRIRDEAHRFAVAYHRKLRLRALTAS